MLKGGLLSKGAGLALLTATGTAHASASLPRDIASCCNILRSAGLEHVYMPSDVAYSQRIESYWSLTSQLHPYCIVQPSDTSDVAKALTVLTQETSCNFAVRSGGHSSNAGANNIDEGVTIDLGLMNTTAYNATGGVVSIQPAARWLSVYQTTDPLDVGVLGGRLSTVGVGGLVTGGGFSFYLYQRGLVCDSVQGFEVALANGTIVEANRSVNADLYTVLKGGSGNFGIVTRIDMEAFERTPIWGGTRTYTADATEDHILAIVDWTDNIENYQNGSAVIFWTYKPSDGAIVVNSVLTDVGGVVAAPAFDRFLAIPGNTSSTLGLTNMSTLATGTQAEGYRKAVELHEALVNELLQELLDGDFEMQCFFQPFPAVVGKHSAERGGNILGVDAITENAIVWLGSLAVNGVDGETLARRKMQAWKDAIEEYSRSVGAYIGFRYANYADQSQDVMSSYGEHNVKKMLEVSEKYDPNRVFQARAPGGFKLPSDAIVL
ncbi:FAD linked oxidase [Lasiodiplodia theobromae]|nr:FAD linked oxidase [Lasiodiplodia theobromae]